MIHAYKLFDKNIVIDVYSGSVHVVDDVAFDAIVMRQTEDKAAVRDALLKKYPDLTSEDIGELFDDIDELEAQGRLYAKDIYENMAFALKLKKKSKDEIKKRVLKAAKILGIEELLQRKPKQLSGGQRQRVAIGRAIVREPKVFLMDEPLSNLDAKMRNQMRAEIIKLHKELDTTFIYVTHDQTEAMTLGTRIVIMKNGFIQQIGTPKEIFNRPNNLFVAGFIGTPQMNFFEDAVLLKKEGKYFVKIFGKEFALSEQAQEELKQVNQPEGEIIAGVRPEDVEVCDKKEGVTATIDVTELMGSEVYLHVDAPNNVGSTDRAVLRVKALLLDADAKEVSIIPVAKSIHLFDKNTGVRLGVDADNVPSSTLKEAIFNQ